ncbi:transposase [bacterium]|nr:transposase [bacterium]MBU1065421.1 transposase [bacterium]MBU1633527.1 transposase [bacterium]MBU1874989.1 transposase [bacterium]
MPVEYTYYHLYNRGCNKDLIFFKEDHYLLLLRQIKNNYQKFKLRIVAYCLMPNHYHLMVGAPFEESFQPSEGFIEDAIRNQKLITQPSEGYRSAIISKFMQNIFNSYVQTINFDIKRKGTLFESKYKSIRIDKEEYLLQLIRYIHLNPVLAGICTQPDDWVYSNCKEWLGLRGGELFDRDFFSTYFQTFEQYREFLYAYKDDQLTQKKMRKYGFDI